MTRIITLDEINKRVAKTNEKFGKMTNPQKIVAIAKDCLLRIKIKQLEPKGCLFVPNMEKHETLTNFKPLIKTSLQENLAKGITCGVCAKGALFASFVGIDNKISNTKEAIGNDFKHREHKKLLEIFSKEQLALIETAYEGKQFLESVDLGNDYKKALNFREIYVEYDHQDRTELLIAILENIIKNKGAFKL